MKGWDGRLRRRKEVQVERVGWQIRRKDGGKG